MKILLENIHKITECLLCKQNEWYWIQSNFFSKLIIQGYLMKFFLWTLKCKADFCGVLFSGYYLPRLCWNKEISFNQKRYCNFIFDLWLWRLQFLKQRYKELTCIYIYRYPYVDMFYFCCSIVIFKNMFSWTYTWISLKISFSKSVSIILLFNWWIYL